MTKLVTNAKFDPENVILSDAKTGEIPTQTGELILKKVVDDSLVTKLGKYEEMDTLEKTFGYFAEGPGAYWVNEGEKIKTSKAKWLTVKMQAHKIGVIIPCLLYTSPSPRD